MSTPKGLLSSMLAKLLFLFLLTANVWAADPPMQLYNEGTKQGVIFNIDCVGSGISCSKSGTTGTLNVSSVGGGTTVPGGGVNAVQYSASSEFTGNESVFSFNGTNVGIGTTNGLTLLDVRGRARISQNLGIGTTLGNHSLSIMNGNTGIGTWNPSYSLQVLNTVALGNATGSHGGDDNMIRPGAASAFMNIKGGSGRGKAIYGNDLITLVSGNTGDNYVRFNYGATSSTSLGTEGMRLDGNTGNVGIGTVGPLSKLEVVGTIQTDGFKLDTNPSAGYVLTSTSTGIGTWMPVAAGGGSGTVSSGTADRVAIYDTAGTTVVSSSVITDDNTNVGIGSTAPGTKLDVTGTIRASTDILVGAQSVCQEDGTNCPASAPAAPAGGTGAVQYNNAGTTAGNEAVFSFNGTNVGVGTTNGNALFSINSTASQNLLRIDDNGIGDTTPFILSADGNVSIGTADTQSKLVVTGGNVGIGTISPQRQLEIYQPSSGSLIPALMMKTADSSGSPQIQMQNSSSDYLFIRKLAAGTSGTVGGLGAAQLISVGASNNFAIYNQSATALQFGVNALEKMRVHSDGNVGIGSVNPTEVLDVAGTVKSTGFRLTTNPSAGYVLTSNSTGIGTWMPTASGSGSGTVNTGIADRVAIYDAAGTTVDSSTKIFDNGTNVGIGTIAPRSAVELGVRALNIVGSNVGIGTVLVPTTLSIKGGFSQIVPTLTDAATVATDASLGNHFRVTLGGNRTLGNPTNVTDGQRIVWELIQDGTGSRTITLDTKFAFGTDLTGVTLTTTASKRDFLTAIYNIVEDKWYVVAFIKGY